MKYVGETTPGLIWSLKSWCFIGTFPTPVRQFKVRGLSDCLPPWRLLVTGKRSERPPVSMTFYILNQSRAAATEA